MARVIPRRRVGALGLGIGVFLPGCALQSELVDLEGDVTYLNDQVQEVRKGVSELQKKGTSEEQQTFQRRLEAVENYLKEKTALIQKTQADGGVRMDQMTADLQLIQGKLEENNHLLSELSQRMEEQGDRIGDLSRRVETLEPRRPGETTPKILLPGGEPEGGKPAPDKKEEKTPSSEIYNQAYRDYLQGNYDLAVGGFSSYLQQSPAGPLAPNAQYWIGESRYAKKDFSGAVEAFEKVPVQYPKNEKVPSALLKIGFAYQKLGNGDLARTYLKRVVEQFPYSRESSLAKVKLAEMP
ncbi:MAG: tol-pal system protein YbgF [Nitrospirae bacterium]|nr:tol-pal system protein YbgF [Nitrospirota bacterium]